MAETERIWDGDRYAVSIFMGHQPLPEIKVWDKVREVHVWEAQYIPDKDIAPNSKTNVMKNAVNKAKQLEWETEGENML